MKLHRIQSGSIAVIVIIAIFILVIGGISFTKVYRANKSQSSANIASFDACVKEGYPVTETAAYPSTRSCTTLDGKVFLESIKTASGIKGHAVIASRQPACKTGESCDEEPYRAKYTVVVRLASAALKDDKATVMPELTRVEADANGEFTIQLAPGTYTLEVPGNQPPTAKIQTVDVKNDAYVDVALLFDWGIR